MISHFTHIITNTQNYWGPELFPLFRILKSRKHNVLETGSVSVLRWLEEDTLLGPLERADQTE
jgi:hypothetical protein